MTMGQSKLHNSSWDSPSPVKLLLKSKQHKCGKTTLVKTACSMTGIGKTGYSPVFHLTQNKSQSPLVTDLNTQILK